MKKTYKTPDLKVVKVTTQQMMAESLGIKGGQATEWGSRRRGSYWDDGDDSEDY